MVRWRWTRCGTRFGNGRRGWVSRCSDAEVAQLGEYIGLLTKWNVRLNLTALALAPMADTPSTG